MTATKKNIVWFAIFLVIVAAATRVLRHLGFVHLPPNVAPIAAMALFGGAILPKRLAIALPIATMVLSDAIIGFYTPGVMVSVYACFILSAVLGLWIRKRSSIRRIVSGSLAGSVLFFSVTNAAVWAFGAWYPKTFQGLTAAYLAGIPFFRNTVLGDLAFTGIMFGAYAVAQYAVRRRLPAAGT
ncbi:MAG: DUF6580 family putative transport protein [Candidatus Kerfeldbacteria bacterium]